MKRLDEVLKKEDVVNTSMEKDLNALLSRALKNGSCDEKYKFQFFKQNMIGKGAFCFDISDIEDDFNGDFSEEYSDLDE